MCQGGALGIPCLARVWCTAKWWLLEPFWGIVLLSRLQLCREDLTNVTCMPWHWGSPLPSAWPGSSLDKPLELCLQYLCLACRRSTPVCGNDAFPVLVFLPPSLLLFLIVILA